MDRPDDKDCLILHASTVAVQGRAVMILGASGSGKTALALQLMAFGAGLVADDRTCVWADQGGLWADAPDTIRGQIEARNVGILQSRAHGPTQLVLAVDLGCDETVRLPEPKTIRYLGVSLPMLHNVQAQHFPAAILHYLKQDGDLLR